MMKLEKSEKAYESLVNQISNAFLEGQKNAVAAVNTFLVETYWQIGKYIVEFEQDGKAKAEYGANLLPKLSKDLKLNCGKRFSVSGLIRMRQFHLTFPICAELPHKLSWAH